MAKRTTSGVAVTLECQTVQAPQLHHHQEQGQRPRAHRDQEVLQVGPHPHRAQGDPLAVSPAAGDPLGRSPGRSPAGPGRVTSAHARVQLPRRPTTSVEPGRPRPRWATGTRSTSWCATTYLDTYTLAFRLTGDEEDARDVVQESYLRAYRGLRRFRGDAQFSTWLYRITANCASTQLGRRTRHRHDELDDELPESTTGGPTATRGWPDDAGAARPARGRPGRLPPRLRAVVVLRDVYDLPHEAIAAELGISVSAAKVRLHRARRRLREDLCSMPSTPSVDDGRACSCGVTS